jgi:hypothetical protein
MKLETKLFLYGVLFFVPVGLIYAAWSGGEAVGTVGIPLVGGLVGMIGAYFALLARRIDARPEDDPYGEIAEGSGELGEFAPYSWWPLAAAGGAALLFAGLAIGWWLVFIGVGFSALGVIGWVYEFYRGEHAH